VLCVGAQIHLSKVFPLMQFPFNAAVNAGFALEIILGKGCTHNLRALGDNLLPLLPYPYMQLV
jgi:hypothetical protein